MFEGDVKVHRVIEKLVLRLIKLVFNLDIYSV
jgi:hypothetical protein